MIQKGIIESIISAYEYKVRIPRYDKLITTPGGVSTEDLSSAIVCSVPGTKISFAEGDIVLVGFENDELSKPVILGTLYKEDSGQADQFISPIVQSALLKYEADLDELKSNKLYTHIKYSNDNGLTFTSLFDFNEVKEYTVGNNIYAGSEDININPASLVIYWSVIDSNNVDVTSSVQIITTVYTEDDSTNYQTFYEPLISIPLRLRGLNNLKLSFRILKPENYDDLHIVLTTDRNTLGSVYGNYLGINVSTDPLPSMVPNDYSWSSFYDSIYYLVSKVENSLLPRVERNEKALYGYTYSDSSHISDETGILDGISVNNDSIDIHGDDNKNIYFNTSNSMFIDNDKNNFTLREADYKNVTSSTMFSEMYTSENHFMLTLREL